MRSNITDKTVKRYMEHLCDSFLFEESKRYDVKGRKYFSTNSKFYIADIGLKNAKENFRQNDRPHIMENIIFNELRCRGYDVDVGVVETTEVVEGDRKKKALEIDFVANRGNLRIYIQSAYSLDDETKRNTELRPFLKVNDSFKKVIVQKDYLRPRFDDNGILHIGLLNFLMDPNSIQF
jgi:predicted AAA+ superfamily ATPase